MGNALLSEIEYMAIFQKYDRYLFLPAMLRFEAQN
jgi:hypothetical protein